MARFAIFLTFFSLQAALLLALTVNDDQICTKDSEYNTYYPGDCDKYYHCQNGKATMETCGWFHRFDEASGQCKFHWLFFGSVDCTKAVNPGNPTAKPTAVPTTGKTPTSKSGTTPTTASTGTGKTPTTATAPPNAQTTKKPNGAGSAEISMILATICTFATVLRHFH